MKLQLVGQDVTTARACADALFTNLGAGPLIETAQDPSGNTRTDPFTVAIGISGIILMLPPMIDATINLIDRARRDTARKDVEALKTALDAAGSECVITMADGKVLILPKAATDAVVDAVLEGLKANKTSRPG
jgi:hypothetical protein